MRGNMKKVVLFGLLVISLVLPAVAAANLDDFLNNLNIQARADMHGFSVKLSAQFGVPVSDVQVVLGSVAAPADAFMCYQLGQMAGTPVPRVVRVYKTDKGRGWGVIAKSLGIKPGSAEFHALKRGDFALTGEPGPAPVEGPGRGKGKGKGHNK
jgi:hypothetical protein